MCLFVVKEVWVALSPGQPVVKHHIIPNCLTGLPISKPYLCTSMVWTCVGTVWFSWVTSGFGFDVNEGSGILMPGLEETTCDSSSWATSLASSPKRLCRSSWQWSCNLLGPLSGQGSLGACCWWIRRTNSSFVSLGWWCGCSMKDPKNCWSLLWDTSETSGRTVWKVFGHFVASEMHLSIYYSHYVYASFPNAIGLAPQFLNITTVAWYLWQS